MKKAWVLGIFSSGVVWPYLNLGTRMYRNIKSPAKNAPGSQVTSSTRGGGGLQFSSLTTGGVGQSVTARETTMLHPLSHNCPRHILNTCSRPATTIIFFSHKKKKLKKGITMPYSLSHKCLRHAPDHHGDIWLIR